MLLDLRSLIQKLNKDSVESFHEGLAFCSSISHYDVEIPHLMLKLLEKESGFSKVIEKLSLPVQAVKIDLLKQIDTYKTGNQDAPAISRHLIDLLQAAWLLSSLDFNRDEIDSVSFLLAMYKEQSLQQLLFTYSKQFKKIEQKELESITLDILAQLEDSFSASPSPYAASALEQYTVNLVEEAKRGKIDQVIGRENEVQLVIDILGRRRQNNPILVGEPGVGKTAIVEGLALLIAQKNVPKNLLNTQIRTLDLGLLQAGAGVKGEFENRLKQLLKDVGESLVPIILFVDEAHTLIGAGGQTGQGDAANLLKPALARGNLRTIAATTWAEYKKYFEKDAALSRRFQQIIVDEPSEEIAVKMLRHVASKLEKHHDVIILEEAIQQATKLSHRYIPARQLPDKSISILDTAASKVALMQNTQPLSLIKLTSEKENLLLTIARLEGEQAQGVNHKETIKLLKEEKKLIENEIKNIHDAWKKEAELFGKIKNINFLIKNNNATIAQKEQLKILLAELKEKQGEFGYVYPFVDDRSIASVIAAWTGIPVGKVLSDKINTCLSLENTINQRVIGQTDAIKMIAKRVTIAKAKLDDPNKPIGVFLLLGPSGTGKTETALALADSLYGGEKNITIINMSEFKEAHKVSLLMGSPPGYVGYGEGGILTEAVRRKPYNLLLLDEIEKAHPSVQDVFYQVFDKGILKDGEGRDVDFKNTIIIMTSNACSEQIIDLSQCEGAEKTMADMITSIQPNLQRYFKPAFLGRSTIAVYAPLGESELLKIVHLKLAKVAQRVLSTYKAELVISQAVVKQIVFLCQLTELGARQIDNVINGSILPLIAENIFEHMLICKSVEQIYVEKSLDNEFEVTISDIKRKNKDKNHCNGVAFGVN